jgi:spermidine/putrescine transport system substrate-binding protein
MRRAIGWLLAVVLLAGGGYALMRARPQPGAAGELHIYNWTDYTNPELIRKFENSYHVRVSVDTYDTNEQMLAKVEAGNSGYDIVVPADYMVKVMIGKDLLEKVEPDRMENFRNVDPKWVGVYWDGGRHYSVPWQWGTTSFSVDTAVYRGDIDTLALLFDPPKELQGRVNMLDDMNEVINAGLRYLGLPRCNGNPADLARLQDLLVKARRRWRTISYDPIGKLTSRDVDLSQDWSGAALRARLQRPSLRYAFPKEGFPRWMDNAAVIKGARNLDNAKLFLNFIMAPENAALISAHAKFNNGILGSDPYLPPEMRDAPELHIPPQAPEAEIVPPCPDNVVGLYDRIWSNLAK